MVTEVGQLGSADRGKSKLIEARYPAFQQQLSVGEDASTLRSILSYLDVIHCSVNRKGGTNGYVKGSKVSFEARD